MVSKLRHIDFQWVPAIPAKVMCHFNYTYLPNAVTVAETGSNKVICCFHSVFMAALHKFNTVTYF